jgi:hypothetical protein
MAGSPRVKIRFRRPDVSELPPGKIRFPNLSMARADDKNLYCIWLFPRDKIVSMVRL